MTNKASALNKEPKASPQQIYDSLKQMITSLEIIPGSRLTETQLAEFFNVSRTPIRSALQRLESDGLLCIKPKQGCFIRNIDMLQVSQYYEVRIALESMVLEEIANLKDHAELRELCKRWDPHTCIFGTKPTDAMKQQDENFHIDLAKISKNQVLCDYLMDINNHIRVVRRLGWPDTRSVKDTYEEHFLICQSLLNNDLKTAQKEMTKHIRKSQDQANRVTLKQLYANPKAIHFG